MKNALLIFSLALLAFACTKAPLDLRSKYVGTYDVVSYNSYWSMGQAYIYDTTYTTVTISRSDQKYHMDFVFENGTATYRIDADESINYVSPDWHYFVGGEFTDKNHFRLSGGYFGLGGGNSFDMHATKR